MEPSKVRAPWQASGSSNREGSRSASPRDSAEIRNDHGVDARRDTLTLEAEPLS